MEEAAQVAARMRAHLAADEVQRLDAVGAFVDLRDAGVAHELLHAAFADVAVAAEHLHAEFVASKPMSVKKALMIGVMSCDEVVRRLALRGIGVAVRHVDAPAPSTSPARGSPRS